MNRYGSTAEIASAVMYLVSEDASYISGVALPVNAHSFPPHSFHRHCGHSPCN